jgi:hypothetical protein
MQMDEGDARLLLPVTERIIVCAFGVVNGRSGFVEKCGAGAVQRGGSKIEEQPMQVHVSGGLVSTIAL